jgi:hypothetical protein
MLKSAGNASQAPLIPAYNSTNPAQSHSKYLCLSHSWQRNILIFQAPFSLKIDLHHDVKQKNFVFLLQCSNRLAGCLSRFGQL